LLSWLRNFPEFYGTRRFITAFTSAYKLSLPWARSIQSVPPLPTFLRSIYAYSVIARKQVRIACFWFRRRTSDGLVWTLWRAFDSVSGEKFLY
jgi:hypothetical protein